MVSIVYVIFILSFSPLGDLQITMSDYSYSNKTDCLARKASLEKRLILSTIVISKCKSLKLGVDG